MLGLFVFFIAGCVFVFVSLSILCVWGVFDLVCYGFFGGGGFGRDLR